MQFEAEQAVTEQQLAQFPPGQLEELARTVLASGSPVPETFKEFRTLAAAPVLHGPPRPMPPTSPGGQRTRRKRPRRHSFMHRA